MIDVQDLCYAYHGQDEDTIRGISFSIAAGEIFGFLGPSGSGKSTTQKLLIGLLRNYQGSCRSWTGMPIPGIIDSISTSVLVSNYQIISPS